MFGTHYKYSGVEGFISTLKRQHSELTELKKLRPQVVVNLIWPCGFLGFKFTGLWSGEAQGI